MFKLNLVAKISETRKDSNWNVDRHYLFEKEISVDFMPTHGMTVEAYGLDFEVSSRAILETGKVENIANAKKNFTWFPHQKNTNNLATLMKKLQDAGFTKSEK